MEKLPDWQKRLRDEVLEYFRQLDTFIRDIVHMAGEDAHIVMASDHGFGPARYVFHINVLLEELGYLGWREVSNERVKKYNHEWSFCQPGLVQDHRVCGNSQQQRCQNQDAGRPGRGSGEV